jgi:hypothetical protein
MAVVIACVHCHTIKLRWTESQRFHTNRQRSTTGCAPCSISTLATRAVRLTALRFRRPFLAKCNALHRQALCSSRTHVHVSSLAIAFIWPNPAPDSDLICSYRHPVCSFYHFLEHHAPLNPSCLGGHTTHTAVSGYCTGHSSACWSVRPRTAMVSRLAPWWLSIQEFGKIPAGYLTLEQYEDCPEELQPLVRHLCEDVPDQLQ